VPSARHTTRMSPFRSLAAGLLALALAGGGLTLAAPPASADITVQIRDGQARLDALNRQAEAAAERYDAGTIALADARRRALVAQTRLSHDQAALRALQLKAGGFAVQAYESGGVGDWVAMVSSPRGPADALDRMATLNRVAQSQADFMLELATAQHRQAQTSAQAQAAAADATRAFAVLERDKRSVLAAAGQAQQVLVDLQAKQAQLIQQAKDAAARRAAQQHADQLALEAARSRAAAQAFSSSAGLRAPAVRAASVAHYSGTAAQVAVQAAERQLGKPYVWGAAGPDSFDCSGLTMYAYGQAGIALPHYTGDQYNQGRHVAEGELRPGDLIFFEQNLGHVGMYLGNGQFIHAPHSGDVVKISSLSGWYQDNYAGAVRLAG
jgi:cell wall-associated NlpC family hydrolase